MTSTATGDTRGRWVVLALVPFTLLTLVQPGFSEDHSGAIGTETWTLANSPHIIVGNVTLSNGDTLTIEAGCDVQFAGYYYLLIYGQLLADGTTADHITFTSNQPSPSPGDWQYLRFHTADPGCLMDYCDVAYGGSSYGAIYVTSSSTNVTISNCTIEQSATTGIYCADASQDPQISDCTIRDNLGYPIRTYGRNVGSITGTMTVTGNTYNAILVEGDANTSGIWLRHSVPYVINGQLNVANGDTLTLSPGCELRWNGNHQLLVYGKLVADGDPGNHITFTSNQASPSPGDWQYVCFYGGDPGCLMDYCNIGYGGSSYGAIYVTNSTTNVTISNCTIEQSATTGIYCVDVNQDPQISDCTIRDNLGYPIRTYGRNVGSITGTLTITGNTYNAILVEGDAATAGTWLRHTVPYVINGQLTVANGDTLTLSPGCELRWNGNHQLLVYGKLLADGDPGNHITFTSNQASPSPGDWQYVCFYGGDPGCLMDYCDISYGGSSYGAIYVSNSGSNVAISNCTIEQSATTGIYCADVNQDPQISDCTIRDNLGYPIRTYGRNVGSITGTLTITGNTYNAILVEGDAATAGTWLRHTVPYAINGQLTVANGDTLTLSPGCELRWNGNDQLLVYGKLVADGDAGNHITFTSNQPSPGPGDWQYLYFYTADLGCLMDYCDIGYGGSTYGNVLVTSSGANVTVSNCTIEQSAAAGIWLGPTSSPPVSGCLLQNNAGAGINCTQSGANPVVTNCTVQGNLYGVQGSNASPQFPCGNQIISNTSYGFYFTGSSTPTFGTSLAEWNDIYGNGTYDFYNGTSDVYAYYVYWGSTDPAVIASRIYDDFDDALLGIVHFMPWTNAAHDSALALAPPVIDNIRVVLDSIRIQWQPVPDADSYRAYSSTAAYQGFLQDNTGAFDGTVWAAPLSGDARYYYVTALFQAEESSPSDSVGYSQFGTATSSFPAVWERSPGSE